ncbi:MAG TPA: hypothetical protein VKD19_13100 [Pseudolabrys sp.]|nr:hypothetical protein [Pseudolabrys sp.]
MLVERILEKVFPDETGAARLQQVGLFTLIYLLQDDKEPVTASRLSAMTGQTVTQIGNQLQKLVSINLVERAKILNKQGRGYAWHLSISGSPKSRRLAKAIEKAGAKKKR